MAQVFFVLSFLPYINQHPLSIILLCFFSLVAGGFFALKGRALGFLWQVVILALGALVVYFHYGSFRGLEPGLSFLSFLVCVKMFEMKRERDLFIFFFITSVLLVGHLLNIYSFLGLFHFLFICALMLLMMMSFHNKEQWSWPKKDHFKVLAILYALAVPQAIFLFIFFPRVYVGHLTFPNAGTQSKLGFTDELKPGVVGDIIQDETPIFRAQFLDSKRPSLSEMYWRGATLQASDGFNWERGEVSSKGLHDLYKQKAQSLETYAYQVSFSLSERDVGFTLEKTFEVIPRSRAKVEAKAGETFSLSPRSSQHLRYEGQAITSQIKADKLTDSELTPYLEQSDNLSVKIKEFSENISNRSDDSQHAADLLMEHFRQEDFVYTLSPGNYIGENPVDEFLFERKRGFCEHYASVTATVFRLMGIPARVVTGFHGGLYNRFGDYYILRARDAHAWVEGYFKGVGWLRYDPVAYIAPERVELGAESYFMGLNSESGRFDSDLFESQEGHFLQSAFLQLDAIYYDINQFFIGYDLESQKSFLANFGLSNIKGFWLLTGTFTLLFISVLLSFYFLDLNFSKKSLLQRAYFEFLHRLKKAGMTKGSSEPPLKFLSRVRVFFSDRPLLKEEVSQIMEEFIRLFYSGRALKKEELDKQTRQLRQRVKKLRF